MQGTTAVGASDLLRGAIGALTFKYVKARPSHRPFSRTRARRDPCIPPDARPPHRAARAGADGDPSSGTALDDREPEPLR